MSLYVRYKVGPLDPLQEEIVARGLFGKAIVNAQPNYYNNDAIVDATFDTSFRVISYTTTTTHTGCCMLRRLQTLCSPRSNHTMATKKSSTNNNDNDTSTKRIINGSVMEAVLDRLYELQINCLAIDFDQTLIDIHTGGRYEGAAEELFPHVRFELRHLISKCLQPTNGRDPIHICIVTFSPQISLIRKVLEYLLLQESPPCGQSSAPPPTHESYQDSQERRLALANAIPIRGGDRSWNYVGAGSMERKQPFIASAVEELAHQHPSVTITKASTLLIDDDRKNVKVALQDGTRAVWFNPDKPHHLLRDIIHKLV